MELSFKQFIVRTTTAVVIAITMPTVNCAFAAEDAKSFYLLGSNASLAGAVPPPGTYVSTYEYYYSGDASANAAAGIVLDQIGANVNVQAQVDVDADIFISVPTLLWVAPGQVLGGNAGFGVLVPIGWQDISADVDALASLTLPGGRSFTRGARFELDDDTFAFGESYSDSISWMAPWELALEGGWASQRAHRFL